MHAEQVATVHKPNLQITLRDCNSIGKASISLRPGSLNIKYGPNGIGKSTIARALTLRTAGVAALEELTPFKHKGVKDGSRPTVEGADAISHVMRPRPFEWWSFASLR